MAIMAMGRLYEHMAERLTKWGGWTIILILNSITNLIMDGKMLWYPIISTSNFRDAPNAVWLRRQPDVQSVHLPVHQLLLVDHLHRLLQGQVRRLPRPLPQHHGQQPQKWRRKDSSLSNLRPVSKVLLLTQCGNGGCLIELAQQLAVIMIGKSEKETKGEWWRSGYRMIMA